MPAVIRPAYTSLALSAKKRHINGIPLIEHYTLGVLEVVGQELDRPAVPEVPRSVFWAMVGGISGGMICQRKFGNSPSGRGAP